MRDQEVLSIVVWKCYDNIILPSRYEIKVCYSCPFVAIQ